MSRPLRTLLGLLAFAFIGNPLAHLVSGAADLKAQADEVRRNVGGGVGR